MIESKFSFTKTEAAEIRYELEEFRLRRIDEIYPEGFDLTVGLIDSLLAGFDSGDDFKVEVKRIK